MESRYRLILPGVCIRNSVMLTPYLRALAVWEWSRGEVVLSDVSAAAVMGAGYLGDHRDASCISRAPRRCRAWVHVHQDHLDESDVRRVRGVRVTSPVRTAFDVARRVPYPQSVEVVDALYQATNLTRAVLAEYSRTHRGLRGGPRVPAVIEASDEGAESVWETRARLAVVAAGLPPPRTQVDIRRADGSFIARVDMCWPEYRVVFEYDGDAPHATTAQRDRDIVRWNDLHEAGYVVIRVRAPHLRDGAAKALGQLRSALRAAGAPV